MRRTASDLDATGPPPWSSAPDSGGHARLLQHDQVPGPEGHGVAPSSPPWDNDQGSAHLLILNKREGDDSSNSVWDDPTPQREAEDSSDSAWDDSVKALFHAQRRREASESKHERLVRTDQQRRLRHMRVIRCVHCDHTYLVPDTDGEATDDNWDVSSNGWDTDSADDSSPVHDPYNSPAWDNAEPLPWEMEGPTTSALARHADPDPTEPALDHPAQDEATAA